MEYIRKCKTCNENIVHKNENLLRVAIERNGNCRKCAASKCIPDGLWKENENWYRNCPSCNRIISYSGKNGRYCATSAHKQFYECKKCSALKRPLKSEEKDQGIYPH